MIEYDKNKTEIAVERWLAKHGYTFATVKKCNSKTTYHVIGNGVDTLFALPYGVTDVSAYMRNCEMAWLMHNCK